MVRAMDPAQALEKGKGIRSPTASLYILPREIDRSAFSIYGKEIIG